MTQAAAAALLAGCLVPLRPPDVKSPCLEEVEGADGEPRLAIRTLHYPEIVTLLSPGARLRLDAALVRQRIQMNGALAFLAAGFAALAVAPFVVSPTDPSFAAVFEDRVATSVFGGAFLLGIGGMIAWIYLYPTGPHPLLVVEHALRTERPPCSAVPRPAPASAELHLPVGVDVIAPVEVDVNVNAIGPVIGIDPG